MEGDRELTLRIINEESAKEEYLRGSEGCFDAGKTNTCGELEGNDNCNNGNNAKHGAQANKTLKQMCESETLQELPNWFSKGKKVRLRICFPNAYDPKYLITRRKLFQQMKLLKEEQNALKNKSSIIKLVPCAPPSFAKNLKFKPIKGHVVKPNSALSSVLTNYTESTDDTSVVRGQDETFEKGGSSNGCSITDTSSVTELENLLMKKSDSSIAIENSTDNLEEEMPRRRSRRKV